MKQPLKSLYQLLDHCNIPYESVRVRDFDVSLITRDSRSVQKNSIFVAIKGTESDGNFFIPEACEKGAQVVVTDQDPAVLEPTPLLKVGSARRAYARLVSSLYDEPSQKLNMFAVTGTNGKTTCAYLLDACFSAEQKTGLLGTIEYRFNGKSFRAPLTTPDALRLHSLLREMVNEGVETVVLEASSHALEQERLFGMEFKALLFTNITGDHLDYHQTFDQYRNAKAGLIDLVCDGGAVVLNADDPAFDFLRRKSKRVVSYGVDRGDFRAKVLSSDLSGSTFDIHFQDKATRIKTPLFGHHNVYNITGAFALAVTEGMAPERFAKIVEVFEGVPGRLEGIDEGQDFGLFIDYAHTEDGLKNVLQALRPYVEGQLLLMFGCGGDRDRSKRAQMAGVSERLADFVILTTDNPRTENPKLILKEIESGFSDGFRSYCIQPDRRKAIRQIMLRAGKGDVVLLAGKGHEDYQIIGDQKTPFSDLGEALKVLQGR